MSEPKPTSSVPPRRYLRAPVPVYFPSEEKVPETEAHLRIRTALWQMLDRALEGRAFVGSEQFVYWDVTDPKKCLAPDLLVRLGPHDGLVRSWKTWERGAPHLALEVTSDSDVRDRPWGRKFAAYQQMGVLELVRFDPANTESPLRLWDRVDGDLIERKVSKHELERSDVLDLHWLVERSREFGLTLRLSHDAGGREPVLTGEEAEAKGRRIEAEARRMEAEARRMEAEARRVAEARADTAEAQAREAMARVRELEAELARKSRGE